MVEDAKAVPPPSPIESVLESGAAQGAAIYLVRLPPAKGRALRVNITLDENLLKEIDIATVQLGMSRSGFLSDAARSALGRRFDERLEKADLNVNQPPDLGEFGRTDSDS
jgi:hypothetical protein